MVEFPKREPGQSDLVCTVVNVAEARLEVVHHYSGREVRKFELANPGSCTCESDPIPDAEPPARKDTDPDNMPNNPITPTPSAPPLVLKLVIGVNQSMKQPWGLAEVVTGEHAHQPPAH